MKNKLIKIITALGLLEVLQMAKAIVLFVGGMFVCVFTDKTPASSYQAMVLLFCRTSGKFNDFISSMISFFRPVSSFNEVNGVLGRMTQERLSKITQELNERGYYVFNENKLSAEVCDRILQLALEMPVNVREVNQVNDETYNRSNPRAVRYDFSSRELLKSKDIQDLVADPTLEIVAKGYLKTNPIIDIITMWWNTAFSPEPSKEAAQYFHFDMDRLKWVKFFFYITDVGPDQGPHTFIEGSHRSNTIPNFLLKKGYARLEDDDVLKSFPVSSFKEFTGLRGTIIAEDTRGLHKGKNVKTGDRLVFQLQYSNHIFGSIYDKQEVDEIKSKLLESKLKSNKKILRNFFK